jgi:hypothetical protein
VESHPGCWGPPARRPFQGRDRFTSERIGLRHKPRDKDHDLGRRAGPLGISLIPSWKRVRWRFTRLGSGYVWRGCGIPGSGSSILHLTRSFTQPRGTRSKHGIALSLRVPLWGVRSGAPHSQGQCKPGDTYPYILRTASRKLSRCASPRIRTSHCLHTRDQAAKMRFSAFALALSGLAAASPVPADNEPME